jgi:hypothetical protein
MGARPAGSTAIAWTLPPKILRAASLIRVLLVGTNIVNGKLVILYPTTAFKVLVIPIHQSESAAAASES